MKPPATADRVWVSPRYLAGGGLARLDEAIKPLVRQFGWPIKRGHTTRRIALSSPDRQMTVEFEPTQACEYWWTLRHDEPHWRAVFSHHTPIEAITAVLHTLPQLGGDVRHLIRIGPLLDVTPEELAETRGWSPSADRRGERYTSPDGHCSLLHDPGAESRWTFEHTVAATRWSAHFTQETPEPLVSRFFANLAAPIPVERLLHEVPLGIRSLDTARISPVRETRVPPRGAPVPPQTQVVRQQVHRPATRR